jgi:hypothetical protein
VKFARCNAQTLPAFFDRSTPIFFHLLGIFFVKFESVHPQSYEIHHRGRRHPVSLLAAFVGSRGWSVKYPIGLETRTLHRVTGTSVSWSRASRRNGTPVYVEKVRSQFLSLRQSSTELRTPFPADFTPEIAASVLSKSLFDPMMRISRSSTSTRGPGYGDGRGDIPRPRSASARGPWRRTCVVLSW